MPPLAFLLFFSLWQVSPPLRAGLSPFPWIPHLESPASDIGVPFLLFPPGSTVLRTGISLQLGSPPPVRPSSYPHIRWTCSQNELSSATSADTFEWCSCHSARVILPATCPPPTPLGNTVREGNRTGCRQGCGDVRTRKTPMIILKPLTSCPHILGTNDLELELKRVLHWLGR